MRNSIRFFICISLFMAISFCVSHAYANDNCERDDDAETTDSIFKGTIFCQEEDVYIYMDFLNQAMIIPGQEVFGEMAGYFKASYDSRYWMITSAEIDKKGRTATMEVINDYGSEDLTATLSFNPKDSTYTLKQVQGSTIKFGKNRKWQKLPKELRFKRKE